MNIWELHRATTVALVPFLGEQAARERAAHIAQWVPFWEPCDPPIRDGVRRIIAGARFERYGGIHLADGDLEAATDAVLAVLPPAPG